MMMPELDKLSVLNTLWSFWIAFKRKQANTDFQSQNTHEKCTHDDRVFLNKNRKQNRRRKSRTHIVNGELTILTVQSSSNQYIIAFYYYVHTCNWNCTWCMILSLRRNASIGISLESRPVNNSHYISNFIIVRLCHTGRSIWKRVILYICVCDIFFFFFFWYVFITIFVAVFSAMNFSQIHNHIAHWQCALIARSMLARIRSMFACFEFVKSRRFDWNYW